MRTRLSWWLVAAVVAIVVVGASVVLWWQHAPRAITVTEGKFPEELVYVRSADDFVNGGAMYSPPRTSAKQAAVIWIHGWGTNFYSPTYTMIGRALAARGYTTIAANTRMHDLGNVLGYRYGKRIRGGGYWGVASEEVRDLAAWIDFAETRGFRRLVLVGHSAGWAAVRRYESETEDARVVGVVAASGAIRAETRPTDPDQLAQARRLMAAGEGDALIRDPKRSFPSYISAATFMDIVNAPPAYRDFFGEQPQTQNPGVARVRCPLLAFFGDKDDVGTGEDLRLLTSSIARQPTGPSRVTTAMIQNADHMYTGEEAQVAETIARWADGLSSVPDASGSGKR